MNLPQNKLGNERIVAIDILRGFAVLGILLINIRSYAMPDISLQFDLCVREAEVHGNFLDALWGECPALHGSLASKEEGALGALCEEWLANAFWYSAFDFDLER
jgi:hypothetical protein